MTHSLISRIYPQIAQAILQSPSNMLGAVAIALLLGFNPALTSTVLHAQELAHTTPAVTVNINSADAQTLAHGLKGVGMSRAQEIVTYRETFGPFASIDELVEVKGVGMSTVDKNRAVLTLD
ncbi:MAG: ComEA family DNA-binding protein [Halioglobus sp.]